MAKLLQIDFPFEGPFGPQMTQAFSALAQSITQEPGLIWKIWTENEAEKQAGGIYLFANEDDATAYLEMHTKRLKSFGISEVNAKIFDVNEELSHITHALIPPGT